MGHMRRLIRSQRRANLALDVVEALAVDCLDLVAAGHRTGPWLE
jgi:hypothetical protein